MITLKIKNAPSGAKSWIPAVYLPGGVDSPDATLSLTASYQASIGTGAGVNFVDMRFIVYSNNPGAGWNTLASKDLYSQQVTDGHTYTFNWSTGQMEDNSAPPPDPEFRDLKIYNWPDTVEVGNDCRLEISFEYRGPAITKKLYAAIGQIGGFFDEILHKEITLQISNTPSWLKYYCSVTIPITSAISPGTYDLYCKLNGLIPTIVSPYVYNAVTVQSGYPPAAFRNVAIIDHSTQVQFGQSIALKVQYQYQGPGGQVVLYGAAGNIIAGVFDEILADEVTLNMPASKTWKTIESWIYLHVAQGSISPGVYDLYAKIGNTISPYLQDKVEILQPAVPEVRSLAVTGATSPVKAGSTCWIDFRFEYRGPASVLTLYGAIGMKGITFDEVIAGQQDFDVPAADSWTVRTGRIPLYITEAIDPDNSPYDVYVKILDPLIISSPKMGAVVIAQDPGLQDITGQILTVEPARIKAGNPLEILVNYQVFDDKAWDQINGWWTRVTVTLGSLTGKQETFHLGRDANDIEEITLGIMPSKNLTGKVILEGATGGNYLNPLDPTPPTSGWYTLDEKSLSVAVTGTTQDPGSSGSGLGLAAIAGLGALALLAGSNSGTKTATRKRTTRKK